MSKDWASWDRCIGCVVDEFSDSIACCGRLTGIRIVPQMAKVKVGEEVGFWVVLPAAGAEGERWKTYMGPSRGALAEGRVSSRPVVEVVTAKARVPGRLTAMAIVLNRDGATRFLTSADVEVEADRYLASLTRVADLLLGALLTVGGFMLKAFVDERRERRKRYLSAIGTLLCAARSLRFMIEKGARLIRVPELLDNPSASAWADAFGEASLNERLMGLWHVKEAWIQNIWSATECTQKLDAIESWLSSRC